MEKLEKLFSFQWINVGIGSTYENNFGLKENPEMNRRLLNLQEGFLAYQFRASFDKLKLFGNYWGMKPIGTKMYVKTLFKLHLFENLDTRPTICSPSREIEQGGNLTLSFFL